MSAQMFRAQLRALTPSGSLIAADVGGDELALLVQAPPVSSTWDISTLVVLASLTRVVIQGAVPSGRMKVATSEG